MVKFENRVAFNKVSHFVKTTSLIIFLDCSNKAAFQESNTLKVYDNFLDFLQKQILFKKQAVKSDLGSIWLSSMMSIKAKKDKEIGSDSANKVEQSNNLACVEKNLTVVTVKNRYFRKALSKLVTKAELNCRFSKKNVPVRESTNALASTSPELTQLMQGNRLAILFQPHQINRLASIKNILKLETTKDSQNLSNVSKYKQGHFNVTVLGAIYKNKVIDHNQIKRLAGNSENNRLYLDLFSKLRFEQSFLISLFNVHGKLKIIVLLKLLASLKKSKQKPLI